MLKRDKTKKRIIDIALELFKEKGIQNTSVDEIVTKSGVAKGTFFYHFHQKDQIVYEIIHAEFEGSFQTLEQIVQNKKIRADEKMQEVLFYIFSSFKSPTVLEQIFSFGISHQYELFINELRLEKLVPIITQIIDQGKSEGIFKLENVEVISSIVNRGIIAYVHTVYPDLKQQDVLQAFLSGTEELINNVLKSNRKINITQKK